MGEDARRPARSSTGAPQEKRSAQCWDSRFSVGKEYGGVGGEERGYDGAKKVKGRKRHLLVDTEGFVLKAKVI
jgi:putative transposase